MYRWRLAPFSRLGLCGSILPVCLASGGSLVFAAHPLQTEDTGTQGSGNLELENGFSGARTGDARLFLYQPQLSVGVTPALDLILQPSWQVASDPATGRARGRGDTNLDAKWRFFGAMPWSAGVRFGTTLPTSQHDQGEPHGTVGAHALMIATFDRAPFTLHLNAGLGYQPGLPGQRTQVAQVSAAGMWAVSQRFTWTVDTGAQSSRDQRTSAWGGYVLLGAIYRLQPGLDGDIGYFGSLRTPVPSREWRLGLTYRFKP